MSLLYYSENVILGWMFVSWSIRAYM